MEVRHETLAWKRGNGVDLIKTGLREYQVDIASWLLKSRPAERLERIEDLPRLESLVEEAAVAVDLETFLTFLS